MNPYVFNPYALAAANLAQYNATQAAVAANPSAQMELHQILSHLHQIQLQHQQPLHHILTPQLLQQIQPWQR